MNNRGIGAAALALAILGALSSHAGGAAPLAEVPTEASGPLRVGGLFEASTIWSRYKARFVSRDGRIVDTANGGISHSEGQGYGLLLAVAAGDRAWFDRILSWTNRNLFVRDDHLAVWRWSPSEKPSGLENNATDGDILIAWALAEAADYWREPAYLAQAELIAADIATLIRTGKPYGPVLSPALRGFSSSERPDGPVVNPSYWVFPAFPRLEQLAPGADWRGLEATGLSLIEASGYELTSDWLSLGKDPPRPAEGFPGGFGYNAIRIPLYAFWSGVAAPRLMQALSNLGQRPYEPSGSAATDFSIASFVEPGYQNILSLARCAATGQAYPPEFYRFTAEQNYYPATLAALSLLAAAYRGGPCLNAQAMAEVLGGRSPTAASDLSQLDTSAVVLSSNSHASDAVDVDAAPNSLADELPAPSYPRPVSSPVLDFAAPAPSDPTAAGRLGRIIGGMLAFGLCVAALALFWRRRQARRRRLESLVSPNLDACRELQLPSPRDLPTNPYFTTTSFDVLGSQIEHAATVSVELGRTLGIVYFPLGGPNGGKGERSSPPAAEDLGELAAQFRRALRKTDQVAVINEVEIIACISLLPGLTELATISERLRAIGRQSTKFGSTFESPAGLSVYPMCGYRATDLLEYARVDYHARMLTTVPEPARLSPPKKRRASPRPRKKKLESETS